MKDQYLKPIAAHWIIEDDCFEGDMATLAKTKEESIAIFNELCERNLDYGFQWYEDHMGYKCVQVDVLFKIVNM